jgi:hypothetical protein
VYFAVRFLLFLTHVSLSRFVTRHGMGFFKFWYAATTTTTTTFRLFGGHASAFAACPGRLVKSLGKFWSQDCNFVIDAWQWRWRRRWCCWQWRKGSGVVFSADTLPRTIATFAYADLLENHKLDAVFHEEDGRALTFYVPKLLSFLLQAALYS